MTPFGTALKPEDGGRCGDCQISLGFSEFNLKDLVIIAGGGVSQGVKQTSSLEMIAAFAPSAE